MDNNRPRSREVHKVSGTGSVQRRGSGLGTGPVGTGSGGRPTRPVQTTPTRSTGGKGKLGIVAIFAIALFLLTKTGILGNDSSGSQNVSSITNSTGSMSTIMGLLSSQEYTTTETDYSSYINSAINSGSSLDSTVLDGAREKRTEIIGGGEDTVTIMVYMCGTDLESKSGMASSDIKEMCNAKLSDKINLIIYTGGCNEWKTAGISSEVNQVYKINNGKLQCLESNMGNKPMTDPDTLTEFINYCTENYPANRQELIMWDHGGGSISGFGYDEKAKNGSMNLAGIDKALKNAGTTFDFIGFDACLMATVENGLMLSKYADYMIASEETEPGVGWYYTNWLTNLSNNTSKDTILIGKEIIDDFVDVCNSKCRGQKTTLSIVDLAELETSVPKELKAFAQSTNELIQNDQYIQVSDARNKTREFAQSSNIDQIDLVHFAMNLNTEEGTELAEAVKGAVKYNRSSYSVSDAYGLSIYFPYKKASKVDQIVRTYDQIGMDEEYSRCIQEFASLEMSGQIATGGETSPMPSLLGNYTPVSMNMSFDSIAGLLDGLSIFRDSSMTTDRAASFISSNYIDTNNLQWTTNYEGRNVLKLTEREWKLVEKLDLNVFYDDGQGYIDLGLDNVFDFDKNGNLYGEYDGTWLSINKQVVAYYHLDTVENGDDYIISGYIPAFLNGERVELQVEFTDENPYGYIAGVRYVYTDGNETVAKDMLGLKKGDRLDFICDYYTYDGQYINSYYLGETMTLGDEIEIGNIEIDWTRTSATYCLTDIYQQTYWTPVIYE